MHLVISQSVDVRAELLFVDFAFDVLNLDDLLPFHLLLAHKEVGLTRLSPSSWQRTARLVVAPAIPTSGPTLVAVDGPNDLLHALELEERVARRQERRANLAGLA